MELGEYWVRMRKDNGWFPAVFFESKKECDASMKGYVYRNEYTSVKVVVRKAKAKSKD